MSLNVTAAKITAAFYEHGAPGLRNALSWTGLVGTQERGGVPPLIPNPRQMARLNRAFRKVPLQAADVDVAGTPVPFWRDFTAHAAPGDRFWSEADHDHADMARLPPASMVTGWWDLFAPGQLRDYAAIRAAGVTARITVGPWLHGEPGELRETLRQDVAWLDHHLNGEGLLSCIAQSSGVLQACTMVSETPERTGFVIAARIMAERKHIRVTGDFPVGERILVPQCRLSVTVVAVRGKTVRLAISAPARIDIIREELWHPAREDEEVVKNLLGP